MNKMTAQIELLEVVDGQRGRVYDKNGFLHIRARIYGVGVMQFSLIELGESYEDEKQVGVLTSEDVLFSPHAMASLEGMPITATHHAWINTEKEVRRLEVGNVKGVPRRNGPWLEADLVIRDKETIEKIESGNLQEVSAGFHAPVEASTGEYEGEPYGYRFTQVRFNHITLLEPNMARGGRETRILNNKHRGGCMENTPNLRTIKAFNRKVRVAESDAEILTGDISAVEKREAQANAKVAELTASIKTSTDKVAELEGKVEELTRQLEASKITPDKLQEAVDVMAKEQQQAIAVLNSHKVQSAESIVQGKADHALRVAVLASVRGEEAVADKDENYIKGAYAMLASAAGSVETSSAASVIGAGRESAQKQDEDPFGYGAYRKHKGVS